MKMSIISHHGNLSACIFVFKSQKHVYNIIFYNTTKIDNHLIHIKHPVII